MWCEAPSLLSSGVRVRAFDFIHEEGGYGESSFRRLERGDRERVHSVREERVWRKGRGGGCRVG